MASPEEYHKYMSYAVILALAFIFFKMIAPYASYLALGIVLAVLIYPAHLRIKKIVKNEKTSAGLTTFLAFLVIVIPAILMLSSLVTEMINFITQINIGFFKDIAVFLSEATNQNSYLSENLKSLITNAGQYLLGFAPNLLGSIAQLTIGVLLMFLITYYSLADADTWRERLKYLIPLNPSQKEHLIQVTKKVVISALYGEVLIASVQGILGGILFSLLGIPNPVFWGFIMGLLAFLPFVGTAMVWGPVVIMRLYNGEIVAAIIITLYGVVLMTGADYMLRPKIISQASRIHPMTAILGAFGGLQLFGFQGLILGPMIAALIEGLVTFYYEEQRQAAPRLPKRVNAKAKRK